MDLWHELKFYSGATLTLALTGGGNAGSSIPSIISPRSPMPAMEELNGIQMVNELTSSKFTIDEARWDSRGCIDQERMPFKGTLFVSKE